MIMLLFMNKYIVKKTRNPEFNEMEKHYIKYIIRNMFEFILYILGDYNYIQFIFIPK